MTERFVYRSIDEIIRVEGGQVVATLCRLTGALDLAEDAFSEAALEAVRRWPHDGLPANPGAWLTTVARRKALDVLRRESQRPSREEAAMALSSAPVELELHTVRDDQLRLIFTCCHPSLAAESQVALTLRVVCGLTTAEIAVALLSSEPTTGKRITRAKDKLRANRVEFRIPPDEELPSRVAAVLTVAEMVYGAGHHAAVGPSLVRVDLAEEGIRLARLLVELMPDEPECHGLLALLLSTQARLPSRVGADGELVRLADADRSTWDHDATREAVAILERVLRAGRPGPFQLRAAISCLHSVAPSTADTDWRQIVQLYDMVAQRTPTVVVATNRAIALAEAEGPATALDSLDVWRGDAGAERWHFFHATRADLLERVGRTEEARAAWRAALALPVNDADERLLRRRLADLG